MAIIKSHYEKSHYEKSHYEKSHYEKSRYKDLQCKSYIMKNPITKSQNSHNYRKLAKFLKNVDPKKDVELENLHEVMEVCREIIMDNDNVQLAPEKKSNLIRVCSTAEFQKTTAFSRIS